MPTSANWWRDWSRAFLRRGNALQLQHKPRTGRPRHADIHHRVLLLLERGEDRVTMIDRALENLRLAGAAGALAAAGEYEYPGLLHHLENAAIRRYRERFTTQCELDLEVALEHRIPECLGLEALDVQRTPAR